MDNFHDLLVKRRSIRKYTGEEISPDDVKLILEAGLIAPSSKRSMPCQFLVVENREILVELSKCKDFGAAPIANCSMAIVVMADPEISEAWVEDASIAAIFMQLQAEDLGLGSCWIQVRGRFTKDAIPAEEYIQERLGIPYAMPILCVITLGHKDEERKPFDIEKAKWEKIHIGQWREDA